MFHPLVIKLRSNPHMFQWYRFSASCQFWLHPIVENLIYCIIWKANLISDWSCLEVSGEAKDEPIDLVAEPTESSQPVEEAITKGDFLINDVINIVKNNIKPIFEQAFWFQNLGFYFNRENIACTILKR